MTDEELNARFSHHPPKDGQPERYERIRDWGKHLAEIIDEECPESREKDQALAKVEEAVMWANAAIARRE